MNTTNTDRPYDPVSIASQAIATASGAELQAIAKALKARQQKAQEPELRRRLLKALEKAPLYPVIEFTPDIDFSAASEPIVELQPPVHVRVLISDEMQDQVAIDFLERVIAEIRDGALRDRDWDRFYTEAYPLF